MCVCVYLLLLALTGWGYSGGVVVDGEGSAALCNKCIYNSFYSNIERARH